MYPKNSCTYMAKVKTKKNREKTTRDQYMTKEKTKKNVGKGAIRAPLIGTVAHRHGNPDLSTQKREKEKNYTVFESHSLSSSVFCGERSIKVFHLILYIL
ncbi:hypothetical protein NC651_010505 [Populus alba x Populus x berolinensis]|nr:hypothetical protein NC651_010505 [Populus alba x Populus x berolinensis]